MVQPSRRQVLGLGVAAMASAGPLVAAEHALAAVSPARLARATFRPLVGRRFQISSRGVRYAAVLSSIADLPHATPGHPYRFRLVFDVRAGGPAQGTYRFRAGRLAPVDLFVVPVGGRRTRYEAVVVSA